jgi:two-component system, LytTR family, response regulator
MKDIIIHTCKGTQLLQFENIVRIESNSNYCKIFFSDNSYPLTVSKVLCWFEQHLPAEMFLRTHRTHLVNKKFIAKIFLNGQHVQLINGDKINISRRRKMYVHKMIA